jgi:hypothetical protein
MASRKEIHDWDVKNCEDAGHKPQCLSAHASWYAASNTCSYRGQAYIKALSESETPVRWYIWSYDPTDKIGPEGPGLWDIGMPGNYKRKSQVPLWHESHHIVTNGELNAALNGVGGGEVEIKKKVRGGLLKEGYNLNDKLNMIILPMGREESKKLNLPRHRETYIFSHDRFSAHIESEMEKVMKPMHQNVVQCQLTAYVDIRAKIEKISTTLYPQILHAGPVLLDTIKFADPKEE